MRTVILAGGLGTRLAEETGAGRNRWLRSASGPFWHILKHYAAYGVREFVIALGYRGEVIKRFFADYSSLVGSLSVELKSGQVTRHEGARDDWTVHLVETGLATNTGGRVKRLAPWLGGEPFMLTYGDGLSNVDIPKLIETHRRLGRLATVTAVRPPARFGALTFDGDLVSEFHEKPQAGEGWISGGFFVFEPGVLEYISDDDSSLEADCLSRLAAEGQLAVYRHQGFWQGMDTLRDKRQLEKLWQDGSPPWRIIELLLAGSSERWSPVGHGIRGRLGGAPAAAQGADVICLVRDWVPESELIASDLLSGVSIVRGDVRDQALIERVLGEVRGLDRPASRRADDRRRRECQSGVDIRDQHRRHLGVARSLPAQSEGEADRRRLVGQGLWRSENAALRRGNAARRQEPL